MSKFTFVELFAGIGGVSFGFEQLGGHCLLAAEYDPAREGKRQFVQEGYKMLHPGVKVVGDVRELVVEDVPAHDILSFTFPCQSFSYSGKRGGFKDERGSLYFEALRIADAKKPKIIFAENVKGIIGNSGGKTLEAVVKAANDCGYIIDYSVLNSRYFGTAQKRERWYMVGVREDLIEPEAWSDAKGSSVLARSKRRIGPQAKTFNFEWLSQQKPLTDLSDVLEAAADERYFLNESQTVELSKKLDAKGFRDKIVPYRTCIDDTQGFDGVRLYDNESPTLRSSRSGLKIATSVDPLTVRRITPREYLRLQSFPEGVYERLKAAGITDSQIYSIAGNAVTVNVIEAIGVRLLPYLAD